MPNIMYQESFKSIGSSIYVLIRKEIRDALGITEENLQNFSYKLTFDKKKQIIKMNIIKIKE